MIEAVVNASDSSEHQPDLIDDTPPPAAGVEEIEDGVRPDPPACMVAGSNIKKMAASGAKVESINDNNAPAQFNSAEFENDDDAIEKNEKPAIIPSDEESSVITTPKEIEDNINSGNHNRVEDKEIVTIGHC